MAALKKKRGGENLPAKRREAPPPSTDVGGYEADADSGYEHADSNAFSIPRMYMLQDLSPQVKSRDPAHIEGAEAGMMYNTVTKEVHEFVLMIPCLYRQTFVEWHPRDDGGGFVAEHMAANPRWKRERGGPYETAEGTIVNDTRNFFVLYCPLDDPDDVEIPDADDLIPIVVSMTSTQIRRAQDWMTVMGNKTGRGQGGRSFRLPMFANLFVMGSEYTTNDQGSWYSWKPTDTGLLVPADSDIYDKARSFRATIQAGKVEVEPHESGVDDIPGDQAERM